MAFDFKSILSLMNVILAACSGIAAIGLYQILKVFGFFPWEASKPTKDKELEIDRVLSSMPKVTYCAYIPGQEAENEVLSSMPKVSGSF